MSTQDDCTQTAPQTYTDEGTDAESIGESDNGKTVQEVASSALGSESDYDVSSSGVEVIELNQGVSDTDDAREMSQVSIGMCSTDSENRMVIPMRLNGGQCQALVDSGASFSMISAAWLQMHGIVFHLNNDRQEIRGFGAACRTSVIGKVLLVPVIEGLTLRPIEFKVVSMRTLGSLGAVLAEDFLQHNNFSIDIARKRLRYQTERGAIDLYFTHGACTKVLRNFTCTVAKSCEVPVEQFAKVSVALSVGTVDTDFLKRIHTQEEVKEILLEPVSCQGAVSVLPGFMTVDEPFVLAISAGDSAMHLREGEIICVASSVLVESCSELSGEDKMVATTGVQQDDIPHILSDDLTDTERVAVLDLLQRHRKVFSFGDDDIGQLGVTQHKIELLEDTPIYQKPRRFPGPVSEEIEAQCQELSLLDIIEPSKSAWSSPVVPVRKKDGKLRLCVDYRKLNAVTRPDRFPLPNLTDSVYSLHGMQYFSTMDVVRGFYHLQLHPSSREVTAFASPRGHWQFRRLPFGLRNAPAAFQREMTHVLQEFPHKNVMVYIDDVLVMSRSLEEHLKMVDKVLTTLESYGIKVKPEKCTWFRKEVEYLGHVIGVEGIRKSRSFVHKIDEFPRPTTVRQLREFLGLANFQRKFVPNFSAIQKPLSVETGGRRTRTLKWNDDMEEAFQIIKRKISEDVCLAFPDYGDEAEPLELYVDASGVGAGACLAQKQKDAVRIIAYASTTFSDSEQHYSTIERELTALRWGVKALRPFIIGSQFIIHTDHQPLIYLNNMKLIDSRLARTLEDLADFNFTIQYTPGKSNSAADALSRLYDPTSVHHTDSIPVTPGTLPLGLVILREVPGGGDCLFDSLHLISQQVTLGRAACTTVLTLRETLIDDLMKRASHYNIELNRGQRKQLRLMRLPGQLPCVEVLYAFSQLFGCLVLVHFGGDQTVVFISPLITDVTDLPRIHLQCLAGIHYNPVVEMNGYNCPKSVPERILPTRSNQDHDNMDESVEEVEEICIARLLEETSVDHSSWCLHHPKMHLTCLMVSFEKKSYCALLDTGAQVSCVAQLVVDEHKMPVDDAAKLQIVGIGLGRTKSLGMVSLELGLTAFDVISSHQYAVVPDDAMPYCFILGADYIEKQQIVIDYGSQIWQCNTLRVGSSEDDGTGSAMTLISHQSSIDDNYSVDDYSVAFSKEEEEWSNEHPSLIAMDEIYKLQSRSTLLVQLRKHLHVPSSGWPKVLNPYRRHYQALKLCDDLLIYQGEQAAPVVTFKVMVDLMLLVHYQMAHIGRQKLIEVVRSQAWHPSMTKIASDITSSCDGCQRMKVSSIIAPPVCKIQTSRPFELLALDLLNLPKSHGYLACLVVVDHHSKWLSVVPVASKTSLAVANAFEQRVLPSLLRTPEKVLSDNGPEFVGANFNEMLLNHNVDHIYTTPNRPPSNGLAERTNRTLLELLRVESDSAVGWVKVLPKVVMIYNNTLHATLGKSPSEFLLQERHLQASVPLVSADTVDTWREGNPAFGSFRVGQRVLKKAIIIGNETSSKFKDRFQGPYTVSKVNANGVTYVLNHCVTGVSIKAHHGQLKAYIDPPKYLFDHHMYQQFNGSCEKDESTDDYQPGILSAPVDYSDDSENTGPLDVDSSMYDSTEISSFGGFPEDNCTDFQSEGNGSTELEPISFIGPACEKDNPLLMEYPHGINESYYQLNFLSSSNEEKDFREEINTPKVDSQISLCPQGVQYADVDVAARENIEVWEFSSIDDKSPDVGGESEMPLVQPLHLDSMPGRVANRDNSMELRLKIDTPSFSFSGFGRALPEGSLSSGGSLLHMLRNLAWEWKCHFNQNNPEAPIVAPVAIPAIEAITGHLCTSPNLPSIIETRSRGPVAALPNVQPRTLEYKKYTRRASGP